MSEIKIDFNSEEIGRDGRPDTDKKQIVTFGADFAKGVRLFDIDSTTMDAIKSTLAEKGFHYHGLDTSKPDEIRIMAFRL